MSGSHGLHDGQASTRAVARLDVLLEALIIALLIFAPLAFGAVEIWAREVLRLGGLLIAALAALRVGLGGLPAGARRGVGWVLAGFLAYVAATLVPLPASVLGALSPRAHALYEETVPGYAPGSPSEREAWLLDRAGEPEEPGREPSAAASRPWRSLSVYPWATFGEGLLLLTHLCVFWVAAMLLGRRAVRRVAWTVCVTALLIGVVGLLQGLGGADKLYGIREAGPGVHPLGPFVNRNHFAGYLEMAVPLMLGLLVGMMRRAERSVETADGDERTGRAQGALLAVGLAACLAAIGVSRSRGGILSTAVVLVAFLVVTLFRRPSRAERWAAGLVLVGALVAGAVVVPMLLDGSDAPGAEATLTPGAEPSFTGRWHTWGRTLEMAWDYLPTGSGLGTYRHAFAAYTPAGSLGRWFQAHNDYVQFAAEAGLIGVILFLLGAVAYLRGVKGAGLRLKGRDRSLRFGLLLAVLALAIHSLVEFNLQIPSNGLTLACLAGLALGLSRDASAAPRAPSRVAIATAVLLAAAWVAYLPVSVDKIRADRVVTRAATAEEEGRLDDAVALLDRSAALEPLGAAHWTAAARVRLDLPDDAGLTDAERDAEVETSLDDSFEAVRINPSSAEAWLTMSDGFLARADLASPPAKIADLLAGRSRVDSRERRLARAATDRALVVEPRNHVALGTAGYLLELVGRREEATEYYERALRTEPYPGSHFFLEGQPPDWVIDAARRGARTAVEEGTILLDERVLRYWGDYLRGLGRDAEAHELYHQASEAAYGPFWRANDLLHAGLLAARMGDDDEALRDLEIAEEAGVIGSPRVWAELGRLQSEVGRLESAARNLARVMAVEPSVEVALSLAKVQVEMGETVKAIRTLRRGTRINPDRRETYDALIRLLEDEGRSVEAAGVEREWRRRLRETETSGGP